MTMYGEQINGEQINGEQVNGEQVNVSLWNYNNEWYTTIYYQCSCINLIDCVLTEESLWIHAWENLEYIKRPSLY